MNVDTNNLNLGGKSVGDEEEQLNNLSAILKELQSHADRLSIIESYVLPTNIDGTTSTTSRSLPTGGTQPSPAVKSYADRLSALEEQQQQAQNNMVQLHTTRNEDDTNNNNTGADDDHHDNESHDNLPEDTFTLMMITPFRSQAWLLGLFTFVFQTVLSSMIAADQLQESIGSSAFNVPFKVDPVVRAGQLFAIIYSLATQTDITTSIRILVMFWNDPHWDKILLGRDDKMVAPTPAPTQSSAVEGDDEWVCNTTTPAQPEEHNVLPRTATTKEWVINILLPNMLRLFQGIIVMFVCFVIIVQSGNIIDLLKDFTALMILSDTDNIFFSLAASGYFGRELQRETIDARRIAIKYEASSTDPPDTDDNNSSNNNNHSIWPPSSSTTVDNNEGTANRRSVLIDLSGTGGENHNNLAASTPSPSPFVVNDFVIRPLLLFSIAAVMIGSWVSIVINQINGVYFDQKYPKCARTVSNAFELATEHFGDGTCYGGALNTLECEFEGGDCINFNLAYPLCKGDDKVDVQDRVGDGTCDAMFLNMECDYDGGDCCPYDVINHPSFGDGLCNGGIFNSLGCGYDNGDCNPFRASNPKCPIDELLKGLDAGPYADIVFGDGVCDSGLYNTEVCGYENGDCHHGQIGQSIVVRDGIEGALYGHVSNRIYFSKALSLDGMTMAMGLFQTDEEGNYTFGDAPGLVRVWRYNINSKMWFQLGETIFRPDKSNYDFGEHLSFSASGDRIGISSNRGVHFQVFGFNTTMKGEWSQVGQTLSSKYEYYRFDFYGTLSADGMRVARFFSSEEIRIYHLMKSPSDRLEWVYRKDQDVISYGLDDTDDTADEIVFLKFSSEDGTRLLVHENHRQNWRNDVFWSGDATTKMFQYHTNSTTNNATWIQIGQDFTSPSTLTTPAISANGNRIAVASNSISTDAPGQVDIYDYDAESNEWVLVNNDPIKKGIASSNGDGFGYSLHMNSDGTLLVIASNDPKCHSYGDPNSFVINNCTKKGSIDLYNYNPIRRNGFEKVTPNPSFPDASNNTLDLASFVSDDNEIFGLHFSLSGEGKVLVISGYTLDTDRALVRSYDLEELFNTKCFAVDESTSTVGDISYDCVVDGYPFCLLPESDHSEIGNGDCSDDPPYNTEECGFDGGDCIPIPVEGYPNCILPESDHRLIGDGYCYHYPPYNTEECGFDGGDCIPIPVEGYPNCLLPVSDHYLIGDGYCHEWPPYNTEECGFDGGDCGGIPVKGYPDCFVFNTHWIGDKYCHDWPPYNTEECGVDGGDCVPKSVEGYPDCFVHYTDEIGDGICADWPPYNTEECGFDGGDCLT